MVVVRITIAKVSSFGCYKDYNGCYEDYNSHNVNIIWRPL